MLFTEKEVENGTAKKARAVQSFNMLCDALKKDELLNDTKDEQGHYMIKDDATEKVKEVYRKLLSELND